MNFMGVKTEAYCFDNFYNVARQPNFKNIQIILFILNMYNIIKNKQTFPDKKKNYI